MIPSIKAVNPVGSGDAMLAGLAVAIEKEKSVDVVLKQGNALGTLNAQEETTGYIELGNYHTLIKQIQIKEV